MKIFSFIILIFISSSIINSDSSPSLSFKTISKEISKDQFFYIELNLNNSDTFKQGSFEITFNKDNFKAIDLNSGWSGDQVEIGELISNGQIIENNISNSSGNIIIRIEHYGQSADDIDLFKIKFQCLSNNYGNYDFKLNNCFINNTKIENLPSISLSLTEKSLNDITTDSNIIEGPNEVQVIIPANSINANNQLIIKKVEFNNTDYSGNTILKDISWNSNNDLTETSLMFDICPYHKLQRSAEIIIPYSSSDIPSEFSESDLCIYQWVPKINNNYFENTWVKIGGKVDTSKNNIMFKTNSLGVFLVMANKNNENYFKLYKMNVTPNPFSPNSNKINDYTTLTYYTNNQCDRTLVQIYDVNGNLVKDLADEVDDNGDFSYSGEHKIEWDGTNLDDNIVKTGIYIWMVKVIDIYGNVQKKADTVIVSKNMNE